MNVHVDCPADQRIERFVGCTRADDMKPPVGQITDARREIESQEVAEAKHVIDRAGGVRVVLANVDRALVVHEPVENMRSLAGVGRDDLGVERRVTIGDMGVELHARFQAVLGVVVGARFAVPAGAEELAVRGRRPSVTPDFREQLRMDGVGETGKRGLISFVAHVPFRDPQQPGMAESPGATGHAREAEIGGVGEYGGHQGSRIVRWRAGSQMHESIGEARPAVDFREELGDSQTRQHRVEAAGDRVDRFVLRGANGTDRQAFFSERGLWQIPSGGERVDFPKPSF